MFLADCLTIGMQNASLLMCPPKYFEVLYEINPWMDKDQEIDLRLAQKQWENLFNSYQSYGIHVETIDPKQGLPDMVFAANGALIKNGIAVLPNFRFEQRQPETSVFREWLENAGYKTYMPKRKFEGEGDAMFAGTTLLGGYGFRSDREVYDELEVVFNIEVLPLELVDERFYHLDTCLSVLNSKTIAFYSPAFSENSAHALGELFPNVIEASLEDAEAFGLNLLSTGKIVFMNSQSPQLAKDISSLGFEVQKIDVSEFKKAGGGIKCLSLFLDQIHL